jgi:hypothetical protein
MLDLPQIKRQAYPDWLKTSKLKFCYKLRFRKQKSIRKMGRSWLLRQQLPKKYSIDSTMERRVATLGKKSAVLYRYKLRPLSSTRQPLFLQADAFCFQRDN